LSGVPDKRAGDHRRVADLGCPAESPSGDVVHKPSFSALPDLCLSSGGSGVIGRSAEYTLISNVNGLSEVGCRMGGYISPPAAPSFQFANQKKRIPGWHREHAPHAFLFLPILILSRR